MQLFEAGKCLNPIFSVSNRKLKACQIPSLYGYLYTYSLPIQQACLVNGTSSGTADGLGAAPIKGSSSFFTGVNSSTASRGFQIQKFDLDKKIPVTDMEGVSYYKYDVNVVNREEDVYVDGVLDKSKISIFGGAKQSMHCARKVYYDENDKS